MRFAQRTDFGEGDSEYGEALHQARQRADFIDLSISNPTRCGFHYPPSVTAALNDAAAMRYDADPLGLRRARESVAALYGGRVPVDNLLLTASTSEAYSYILRLFCEPGDNILVPSPSYPLFELLARLHDVDLRHYPLLYHDGWQVDASSLAAAVDDRTRAIVAIHPNNPTGNYCHAADRATLHEVARTQGLPLVVDEVFLDYPVDGEAEESFAAHECSVLTFAMGGLSKLLALPQMKLAWTAVCGPANEVRQAMQRLEVMADTFLSIATPQQIALSSWLSHREEIQAAVQERIHSNLDALDRMIAGTSISRLRVEGGWSVVLRVPALEQDTVLAVRLLREHGVAIHPGSFYGFPQKGWLVLSLLPPQDAFVKGVERLCSGLMGPSI